MQVRAAECLLFIMMFIIAYYCYCYYIYIYMHMCIYIYIYDCYYHCLLLSLLFIMCSTLRRPGFRRCRRLWNYHGFTSWFYIMVTITIATITMDKQFHRARPPGGRLHTVNFHYYTILFSTIHNTIIWYNTLLYYTIHYTIYYTLYTTANFHTKNRCSV